MTVPIHPNLTEELVTTINTFATVDAATPASLDLAPGSFVNTTLLKWTVDTASVERVVRICKGAAPNEADGSCPGTTIALPAGTNYDGTGAGSISVDMGDEDSYWIVTKPKVGSLEVGFETPVVISFNAPAATSFTSTLTTTNQNLETGLNWSGVTNANQIVISQTSGSGIEYYNGSAWVALPVTFTSSNPSSFPSGSLSIRSPNAGAMQLTITATGPHAGSAVRTQNIVVNDLPSVAPLVTTPSVDLDLYAPTRLYVEWKASESSLDQDMGTAVDSDGIQKYAICYDVYKSNASGDILVDKDTDRLAGEGAPCPDLTSQFFGNVSELDADTILVNPLASGSCVAGTQCRTQSGIKYYHGVVTMDPKLNDPRLPNQTYLRYEFKVLTIDNGRNGLLGVKETASFTRIVTDDSVEAWWQFAEDFTQGVDCPGAPAGYTICDSGRHAHHGQPQNSPAWTAPGSGPNFASGDGSILLNPVDDTSDQWVRIDQPLSLFTEVTIEAEVSMVNSVLAQRIVSIGSSADAADLLRITNTNRLLGVSPDGQTSGDILGSSTNTNYHFAMTVIDDGDKWLYRDGNPDLTSAATTGDLTPFGLSYRGVRLGRTFISADTGRFNGYYGDIVIYNRALNSTELTNHGKAYGH